MKRSLIFLSMAVLTLCTSSIVLGATYSIVDIGDLGGSYSPKSINAAGQVVGTMINSSKEHVGYLWENGVITELKTSKETLYEPHDINDSGIVAGQGRSYGGSGLGQAYIWENGSMTYLGSIGGSTHDAWGINDSGQIAGGTTGVLRNFFLWENDNMTDLGQGFAYGINNSGLIVGGRMGKELENAFRWENGIKTDLGNGYAFDVNEIGQVVGMSGGKAVIWNNVIKTVLWDGRAQAISNSGQIVGTLNDSQAVLWENNTLIDLNTLIPAGSGWILDSATDINENGQIIGNGYFNGENHGFLLNPNPVPIPSTISLLGLGLLGLAGVSRSKQKKQ